MISPRKVYRFIKHKFHIQQAKFKQKLTINYKDRSFLFDTTDKVAKDWFYPRYIEGDLHEPEISKVLIDELESSDIFFDVGAHVGYFSVIAANICREGRVYAFEMDHDLISSIQNHIRINQFSNLKAVNAAVSDETGSLTSFSPNTPGNLSTNSLENVGDVLAVKIDLDNFSHHIEEPDLIKVDVEGEEAKVLQGLKIQERGNLDKMLIEIHPGRLSKEEMETIQRIISSNGFNSTVVDHREDRILEKKSITDLDRNVMLFCRR